MRVRPVRLGVRRTAKFGREAQAAHRESRHRRRGPRHLLETVRRPARRHAQKARYVRGESQGKRRGNRLVRAGGQRRKRAQGARRNEAGKPRPAICRHGDLRHFRDVRGGRARNERTDSARRPPTGERDAIRKGDDLHTALQRRPMRGSGICGRGDPHGQSRGRHHNRNAAGRKSPNGAPSQKSCTTCATRG